MRSVHQQGEAHCTAKVPSMTTVPTAGRRRLAWGIVAALVLLAASAPAFAQKASSADRAAQKPRVHVVSFGLWGYQNLFKREAAAAADVLADYFGRSGQVIVRSNNLSRSAGGIASLRDTLQGLASSIDRQEDVLVLFLTSHGHKEGVAVVASDVRRTSTLSPARLSGMLNATGIRYRVVIVSACYSGVFSDLLDDENTLVITAADANHTSFGCDDANTGNYTYFGEAFFGESLKRGVSLDDAFRDAKARVGEREKTEKLEGSNPQMKGGAAVRRQLARVQSSNRH